MKIIIAGSRYFHHISVLLEALNKCGFKDQITEVVSGNCEGVDKLGENWAKSVGLPIKPFPYLKGLGKAGGPIRNQQMADYSDGLIALWDQRSTGTKDMISKMKKLNKIVYIHPI
jgi:hypothetical protein